MPSIDVLIPTYNPKREHLSAALDCILKQTEQDWTALIHDDFHPDSQAEIIVKPFLSDPRIRFEKSGKNLGIGGNWNACFRQTSSPVVAYLFQDDLWEPRYLEEALRVFKDNSPVGFVSLEHRYFYQGVDTAPEYDGVRKYRRDNIAPGLHEGLPFLRKWIENGLHPNVIGEPSFVVMRRAIMEKAGPFLEDMRQSLDVEYWTRLLAITDWYFAAGEEFGGFRVHPSGTSAINQQTGAGLADRLRCLEGTIKILKGADRRAAARARNRAVETMVAKYFNRVGSKKQVSSGSKKELKRFVFRHPIVIAMAIIRYLAFGKGKNKGIPKM